MAQQSIEPPWLTIAREYSGLREIKGAKHEPRVVELFALAGFSGIRDDETAWCAAFVGGVLARAGLPTSKSLAARSYEKWGDKLDQPVLGCVGVKRRVGGAAWQGHVGFVVGASQTKIILLGGNQSDMVNVAQFNRSEFTAFRWPTGVTVPVNPPPLPTTIDGAAQAASEA